MLLIILGAGASFDSVPHRRPRHDAVVEIDRPPLANELFADRRDFVRAMDVFPQCKALIPTLRKNGVTVEQELAKIKEQASLYPSAHKELMAITYYLQYAIFQCQRRWEGHHHGINNYVTLLREIERWRFESKESVCIVSFNYDTILEDAMRQVLEFNIQSMGGYGQKHYTLIKLHGSVNWGRELLLAEPQQYGYTTIINMADQPTFALSNNYVLVNDTFDKLNGLVPGIAIPVDKKDEFACPESHVNRLKELLPTARKLLIIGWRATEADFLNMLAIHLNGTQDLMIVSGDQRGAEETFNNLGRREVRYPTQNRVDIGFSHLIGNLSLLNAFLRMDA